MRGRILISRSIPSIPPKIYIGSIFPPSISPWREKAMGMEPREWKRRRRGGGERRECRRPPAGVPSMPSHHASQQLALLVVLPPPSPPSTSTSYAAAGNVHSILSPPSNFFWGAKPAATVESICRKGSGKRNKSLELIVL